MITFPEFLHEMNLDLVYPMYIISNMAISIPPARPSIAGKLISRCKAYREYFDSAVGVRVSNSPPQVFVIGKKVWTLLWTQETALGSAFFAGNRKEEVPIEDERVQTALQATLVMAKMQGPANAAYQSAYNSYISTSHNPYTSMGYGTASSGYWGVGSSSYGISPQTYTTSSVTYPAIAIQQAQQQSPYSSGTTSGSWTAVKKMLGIP